MRRERIRGWLEELGNGGMDPDELLRRLSREPTESLGFATLDHHRSLRLGHPEAVYCEGKTPSQVVRICRRLADRGEGFLATRVGSAALTRLREEFAELEVSELGRIAHLAARDPVAPRVAGDVLIVTGGTSDLPVAEEARIAATAMGNPVRLRADVGIAALHRILSLQDELLSAAVVVVIAGMDGALPSVVAGLVACPVVAVPTSVGYGAAFAGVGPLLSMLNSCAPGLVVVNIDNGYGAACAATRINQGIAAAALTGGAERSNHSEGEG